MSANHGFSAGELPLPVIAFSLVTVVPVGIGIAAFFTRKKVDTLDFIPK